MRLRDSINTRTEIKVVAGQAMAKRKTREPSREVNTEL